MRFQDTFIEGTEFVYLNVCSLKIVYYYTIKVSYSGTVEWTSDTGVYISFKEQGQETTDNTSITVFPLTPSTKYDFTVATITTDGELGDVVSVTVTTNREYGGM